MHTAIRATVLSLVLASGIPGQIVAGGGAPNPSFARLYAWFDAATGINGQAGRVADGTPLTSWSDRSGKGHGLSRVSSNPTERPTLRLRRASAQPAVEFDGDDYVWGDRRGQFGTVVGAKTIFAVVRVRSADGGYVFDGTTRSQRNAVHVGQNSGPGRWHLFGGAGAAVAGPPVGHDSFQVHTAVFGTSWLTHYIDGTRIYGGAAKLTPLGGLILGARYTVDHRLIGDIAEFLVYTGVLSTVDRQAVEGYLRRRYAPLPVPIQPVKTRVFRSGDGLYHTYRIPAALTTRKGTVLAFAEGRASRSDHAKNDIVLRRSTDGGRTWRAVQVLFDDGNHSLNNPCAMQVRTGVNASRILLMFQRFPAGCHSNCVQPGYVGSKICRTFLMHSDDDGATWSNRVEITRSVKRPTGATSTASGPGIGIQKRYAPNAGRIVFPFNQRNASRRWDVYAVFSDDGGKSWAYGAVASPNRSPGNGNEVQMVELVDGSLLLNSRSSGGTRHRKAAISPDGGLTWTPLRDDLKLNEPQVMGSVLRFTDRADGFAKNRILYAGPQSRTSRVNGAVHVSLDEGKTWSFSRVISSGFYAYSCLTTIGPNHVGCLFETNGYGSIHFARFTVEWLSGGADCLGNGRHVRPYGVGCAGSGGRVPTLSVVGCPTPGGRVELRVDRGQGGSSALLLFGTRRVVIPIAGCNLLVDPLLVVAGPLALDASGTGALAAVLPCAAVPVILTVQAVTRDTSVPRGFAVSGAVEIEVY